MVADPRIPLIDLPTHGFFPLIVLGWQDESPTASRVGNLVAPFTRIAHQYGGYSCLPTELVGLVLRLATNVPEPGALMAAFGNLFQIAQEPLLKELLKYVMRDEARHVAFGVLSLRDYYDDMSASELGR